MSEDAFPWPLIPASQVVIRLAHLREHLGRVIRGSPTRRSDVVAAIHALGGSNHGPTGFRHQVLGTWALPAQAPSAPPYVAAEGHPPPS